MFKEYVTRKEEGENVVINLDRVEYFRPGRERPTDFKISGVDVWLMSGARIWINTKYDDFKRDVEQNTQSFIL